MIMELQKLRGNEIIIFKKMLSKYRGYDAIDLLIHKTLKSVGVSKEEFTNREVKKKKKKEVIVSQSEADQLNKFCDGDSCEVPIFANQKC